MLDPVILVGDVLERLAELSDDSIHCVVTSPPYFGLRDYGMEGQIGLEPTIDEFVETMVRVFREVRRVLRSDGTCWLNLGDSYVSQPRGNAPGDISTSSLTNPKRQDSVPRPQVQDQKRVNGEGTAMRPPTPEGLKQKDLMMVPARVALALQADGWYLRSDIIWSKPNPMPESITDRPTSAHEHLFLLAKSARYFYDADAIREEAAWERWGDQTNDKHEGSESKAGWIGSRTKGELQASGELRRGFRGEDDRTSVYVGERKQDALGAMQQELKGGDTKSGFNERWNERKKSKKPDEESFIKAGRNKRNVWTIPTEPFPDAHFATFPTKLVEPCILAGTSEKGCCPKCGAPWARITETEYDDAGRTTNGPRSIDRKHKEFGSAGFDQRLEKSVTTLGWEPSCACAGDVVNLMEPRPCTVIDPFAGSGTTLLVARRLNRASIGIELNPEYAALAEKRIERWWEKPTRSKEEQAEGQLSLDAMLDG